MRISYIYLVKHHGVNYLSVDNQCSDSRQQHIFNTYCNSETGWYFKTMRYNVLCIIIVFIQCNDTEFNTYKGLCKTAM